MFSPPPRANCGMNDAAVRAEGRRRRRRKRERDSFQKKNMLSPNENAERMYEWRGAGESCRERRKREKGGVDARGVSLFHEGDGTFVFGGGFSSFLFIGGGWAMIPYDVGGWNKGGRIALPVMMKRRERRRRRRRRMLLPLPFPERGMGEGEWEKRDFSAFYTTHTLLVHFICLRVLNWTV